MRCDNSSYETALPDRATVVVPGPIRNAQCLNASTTIQRQGDRFTLSIADIHEVFILLD